MYTSVLWLLSGDVCYTVSSGGTPSHEATGEDNKDDSSVKVGDTKTDEQLQEEKTGIVIKTIYIHN